MSPKCLQCFVLVLLCFCGVCKSHCQSDWKEDADHCYYVSYTKATWHEADKACRDMDAQLTSIVNKREEQFIFSIRDEYYANYWIGLHLTKVRIWIGLPVYGLDWSWTDGSSQTFRKSSNLQGKGECVSITGQDTWQRSNCNSSAISYSPYTLHPLYYICKKNATKTMNAPRMTMTVTSTTRMQTTGEPESLTNASHLITSKFTERSDVKGNNTLIVMIVISAVQAVLMTAVVIALIVIFRRKSLTKSRNLADVPAATPSAPPLSIYENATADVGKVEAKNEDGLTEQFDSIRYISRKPPARDEREANVRRSAVSSSVRSMHADYQKVSQHLDKKNQT